VDRRRVIAGLATVIIVVEVFLLKQDHPSGGNGSLFTRIMAYLEGPSYKSESLTMTMDLTATWTNNLSVDYTLVFDNDPPPLAAGQYGPGRPLRSHSTELAPSTTKLDTSEYEGAS
jgi:hypothetical protein